MPGPSLASVIIAGVSSARTGTATKSTENTLYLNRCFGSTFLVQSDLRFDHSWDKRGSNNGKARNQFVWGIRLVYRY